MLGCLGLGGDVDLWNWSIKQIRFKKKTPHLLLAMLMGEKYRKPKPTNPKPFRFRTDERRMFKEATLEKEAHAPLKEITLVRTPGAKSTSKHQNVIQQQGEMSRPEDSER